MPNALVKQRESIGYVDAILKGIHEIDEAKVMAGLQGLRHIDFSNLPTPLSPTFDLVTGISPGREDFLTLERMHLFALVIRHMAQGVYQWTQKNNRGLLA